MKKIIIFIVLLFSLTNFTSKADEYQQMWEKNWEDQKRIDEQNQFIQQQNQYYDLQQQQQ